MKTAYCCYIIWNTWGQERCALKNKQVLHIVSAPFYVWKLEAVVFFAVNVPHGDSGEGGAEGSEAEDEHRSGVGRVGLVGLAYKHRDDGTSKVLDKEDHGVGSAEALQGDNLRYAGPEGGRGEGVANAEDDHQGDGDCSRMHRQGEAKVDGGEHQGTGDDEGDALAITVIDKSEEGCEEHRAEGGDAGEETCEVWIDAVFHHHQFRGELQEGRYSRVEKHAEKRNEPEARIAQGDADIGKAEFFCFCRHGGNRRVQSAIHDAKNEKRQETDDKKRQCNEQRGGEREMAGDGRGDAKGGSRAEAGHRQLEAHSQCQFMTRKPTHHRLGDGDARHLVADTEDGKAEGSPCRRYW